MHSWRLQFVTFWVTVKSARNLELIPDDELKALRCKIHTLCFSLYLKKDFFRLFFVFVFYF